MEVVVIHNEQPVALCDWDQLDDGGDDPRVEDEIGRCEQPAEVSLEVVLATEPSSIVHAHTRLCGRHAGMLLHQQAEERGDYERL